MVGGLDETGPRSAAALTVRAREPLRHSALFPFEVVPGEPGRLLLVTDPVELTLWERFHEHQVHGRPGIPRRELLAHLRTAATAWTSWPGSMAFSTWGSAPVRWFCAERLHIADFGLTQLVGAPEGQTLGELNARYAAPELFEGRITRSCDQYSLAVLYQELLTGVPPFRVPGRQRLAPTRASSWPDLDLAPATDRSILARAVRRDPALRFRAAPI